ncbi:torsin-1A-interacting protein 2-like [Mugil cephalus]|uniref:torsin-1A-interacting protein 2-like n=1 Tax=Mugil cephalus TaxID=48193 RepID=UPI001FB6F2ED|nr:torsin-1A-interacting protein 2-like [Mugil cephalus]
MDSGILENKPPHHLRRSTRHAPVKVLNVEPTPRGPLKRTKKGSQNKAPVTAINGTKDVENGSDDEESPSKKRRLGSEVAAGSRGDENEMDVKEEAEEEMEKNDSDHEMDIEQDSSPPPKIHKGALGDVNLTPHVVLGQCCLTSHTVNEDLERINIVKVKTDTKSSTKASTKTVEQINSRVNRYDAPTTKMRSTAEYKSTMEAIARSTDVPRMNHISSAYPTLEKPYTRERVNNIPTQRDEKDVHRKKQERLMKTASIKKNSGNSSTGCMRYVWGLVLLVLLSAATLLAYKVMPVVRRTTGGLGQPSRDVNAEKFADRMSLLETQFPSQRPDLWKRSKIHLENHLKTAQPTQPVSLIFTAGRKAERTLECVAQALASSFSSALNASVLHVDGTSMTSQDSDEVKLDIDRQLQAAFEGEKPVAVIHRFEELPPGSTIIFYRYCDHENAVYKRVFLLFTVLLPQDEIRDERSLKEVEEMVHDYLKEKLVGSSSQTAFNKMDTDKYSGLLSRISHLILPVLSEEEVEQKGC